jgi:hypothetical protein
VAGLDTDTLRARLGRRAAPGLTDDPDRLARELNQRFDEGRARFDAVTGFLDDRALAPWLATLGDREGVLDFDLSGARALALLGTRSGVARIDLGPALPLRSWPEVLRQLSEDSGTREWQDLGQRVMGPLAGRLPERVYLASADGLALLPLEAARVNGDALAERHRFVRLASFPARDRPAERLRGFSAERVFLAGAPSDYRAEFLARLDTDPELAVVMDRFLGPGLQVIQGSALASDEFATSAFREADLVHLAMPGRFERSKPDTSWLELSELQGGAGRERLTALALNGWELEAELVTLSGTRWGTAGGAGAGRPPLVTGLLASGVKAVLATGWTVVDPLSDGVLAVVYDRIAAGQDVDRAVVEAQRVASASGVSPREWARWQLWLD